MCWPQGGKKCIKIEYKLGAMKYLQFIILFCLFGFSIYAQGPDFTITPNPVCVGQPVTITNTSTGTYSTFDWSFCAANPEAPPEADILDVSTDNFNKPVFVAIVQDPSTSNFFAFVSNYDPLPINPPTRHITRLDFGPSILNQSPNAIPLNTGPSYQSLEGIQIVQEDDTWYGFVVGGQAPPYISQLNFGSNLLNASPARTYMTNQGNLNYPHDLYVFKDEATGEWFGLTVNAGPTMDQGVKDGSVTRFHFHQGLNSIPAGVNLGGWGILEDPVGIYAIKEGDNWYVFITDRWMGLVRLDFGSSLTNNNPTPQLIGNFGGTLNRPRDISLLRYCDDIYGFVVNENRQAGNNSLVRLHFADGIEESPSAEGIPELDTYLNFPHSISDVLRADDEMFALITNVLDNNIVRIFFPTCDDDIASQTGPNPTPVVYNIPGTQTIELIVDLGLPTQENVCHDIVINALPTSSMSGEGEICEGDTTEIYITFTGSSPWNFTYTDGTTPETIETSNNPYTLTVSPAETTTYSITALSDDNCSADSLGEPVTITVTPIDDATFSYPTQTLCTSSPPASPILADPGTAGTFSASPPGLSINPTSGVINPSASTIGIQYTVTYTTVGNCPDSHNVYPIIVTDQPEADFEYSSNSFCRNEPIQHPTPTTPAASFGEFSAVPEGLSINPVNGAINPELSEPGNYVVTNFIPEADGCPSASFDFNLEIAPLPVPDFDFDTVCQGQLTTLTSTSSIPSGSIAEWIWRYQGNNIGFGEQITYTFAEDGDHVISLRVISAKGCPEEIQKTVHVLRPEAIEPDNLISPHEFICEGHTSPVRLEVIGGFGDYVEWLKDDCAGEPFATTTQPIHFLDPPPEETTTYFARWKTTCNTSECKPITIKVSPLPEVSFEFDTVCYGANTTFISSGSVEEGEIVEYEWHFEPGVIISTGSDTIKYSFTQDGDHNVTVYARTDMFCLSSQTRSVHVLPAPDVDLLRRVPPEWQVSSGSDTLYVCIYNSVTLDAGDPDNPNQVFSWSVGADSDTLRIGASGIGYELQFHEVHVTDTITGCVSVANLFVEFSVAACGFGIHDPYSNANIKIYPNPAQSRLFVDIREVVGEINLEFYNIQGRLVMPNQQISHGEIHEIDIASLKPGIYFIRFYNTDIIHSVKLIVSRP